MKDEELFGLFHRLMRITRRPPPRPEGACKPESECSHEAVRQFRQRGRILLHLEQKDGITQKQLAEQADIRPQSLSELLSKLESEGMILRLANDQDKRETLVYLSAQGRARLDQIKADRAQFASELLSPLSEEEKQTLATIFNKLIEARTASDPKGAQEE